MNSITIGSREARNNFADLVGRVHYSGETVIVERSGKPMLAMIPIDVYEQMIAEREALFQVVDRLKERVPDLPEEEVIEDVSEAVAAVRASRNAG
ncbi:MAG: type II toxin-antitoxin system Phd/YefM family antitoxin [Ardenticatenaceae bacterium]|nr:type II toxin-antitoxin system Phd/YefM family antitoxin [Ardenticatenaceae bacterium]